MTTLRRLFLNLCLAAAAVAATLGIAELAARAFVPAWAPTQAERNFWAYDPVLGWTHRPGESGRFVHRDFDVSVAINDQGLRDDGHPYARVPGRRRMLVLGDSFAWGFGVEREEIFHSRLEQRRPHWEMVNAGVSGYGTDQELLWWVRRGVSYRPDVVLLLLHEGDVKDNNFRSRYGYRKAGFVENGEQLALVDVPVRRAAPDRRLERYLFHNTWLLARLYALPDHLRLAWSEWREASRERLPAVAAAADAGASTRPKPRPAAEAEPDEKLQAIRDFGVTGRLLELCQRVAQLTGTRLVVVSHHLSLSRPPPPIDDVLDPLGVPHLSLRTVLGREYPTPLRFEHDMHWTPFGHQVVADAVEAFMVELGIFEASG